MITIPYTIYATDDNQTECGQWNFSVSFGTITDPCSKITGIDNFQWKNISFPQGSVYDTYGETAHGQDVNFHLPDDVEYDIELKFTVHTLCGDYHPTRNFEVTQEDSCTGCTSSFCYDETFCDNDPEEPFAVRIDAISLFNNQQFINFDDTHINYNGPYYIFSGGICQYTPNIYDLINDLNDFLDGQHIGHAVLKYYDANDPGYNGCKIRIRIRESDLMMDLVTSKTLYINNPCQTPINSIRCPSFTYTSAAQESRICLIPQLVNLNDFSKIDEHSINEIKIENTSDINDFSNNNFTAKVYPNISFDKIILEVNSINNSSYLFEIYNINGLIVRNIDLLDTNRKKNIDISAFPPGLFIIKVVEQLTGKVNNYRFFKI